MCVSPVLARRSIPVPAAALGPRTTRVRLRTGQLCLGSHFSVTEGADRGAEAGPKSVPAKPFPCLSLPACPGNPSRAPPAASKPGHRRRRLCLSLSRPAKSLSSSSPLVLSREPPPATWHSGSARCSECVCVCVFTFEGVPLALCYGICLRFCLSIVRVGVCKA